MTRKASQATEIHKAWYVAINWVVYGPYGQRLISHGSWPIFSICFSISCDLCLYDTVVIHNITQYDSWLFNQLGIIISLLSYSILMAQPILCSDYSVNKIATGDWCNPDFKLHCK